MTAARADKPPTNQNAVLANKSRRLTPMTKTGEPGSLKLSDSLSFLLATPATALHELTNQPQALHILDDFAAKSIDVLCAMVFGLGPLSQLAYGYYEQARVENYLDIAVLGWILLHSNDQGRHVPQEDDGLNGCGYLPGLTSWPNSCESTGSTFYSTSLTKQ
jgi:hypothetical protein